MPKTGKRGHARAVQAFGTYANPLTFGFALFLVWQNAAFSFLFPSSADQMVSPLFVGNLSAVFLLLFCVVSYKRDREAFSPAWCIGISFIATIAAITAGILVAQTLLPLWGIYVASAIVGFSTATVAYVWTTAFAGLSARRVLVSVGIAFFLSSALDLVAMNSGYFTIPVLVGCCGVGSWVCFVLSTRAGDLETAPLLVRPTRTCEFAKLAVGIVLFAFALGIVAGTTADVCTEESMRQLNENVVLVALVVGALLLVALALGGRRVETMTLLKVFAPCLVTVSYTHLTATPDETEEDVAADIFKYDLPAMPVVDERGGLLGIVTTDDAWDAIEEDVSGDKVRVNALMVVGIAVAALLFLGLYTLVLFQIIGYSWS